MTNCRVVSTQDTLFCGPLPDDLIARYAGFLPDSLCSVEGEMRQRYINCEIFGSVDYIFGCGAATFEQCTMVSVNDGRDIGYVAAPSHSLKQTEGFLFKNCHFRAADGVKDGSVYLARAWRDFGKATFENCQFDKCIHEDRFANWQGTDRYRFNRFLVTLS
jgi:pectinesterase